MTRTNHLLRLARQLNETLVDRRIVDGFNILDKAQDKWTCLDPMEEGAAVLVLSIAQWVDVGYRDHQLLDELLVHFPISMRSKMPVREYLLVRLTEAFRAMTTEDADTAIELLDFVLKAEPELIAQGQTAIAHFWNGRAHRKKGEYEIALRHIVEARKLAEADGAVKLVAVIKIQEGWLLFQKGDTQTAVRLLDDAEEQLRRSDDLISLGNIASARGRIVRRTGEYKLALDHYQDAIAIYGERHKNHRNLARALVNAAYVKRLIALQLRKRIDSQMTRERGNTRKLPDGKRGHYTRYTQLCREALAQLETAGAIYETHHHHGGSGSVLVNAGHLHLDMGDIDKAMIEALKAYALGHLKQDHILMTRARILETAVANVRVDSQSGEDLDTMAFANNAHSASEEAVSLAKHTQNRRLLAGAYLARGATAANDFFQDWDNARHDASRAAALLRADDRDHLWEELLDLKAKMLQSSGIDERLRAWSDGTVGDKSFQQVSEEFAEIVIRKVWSREGEKVSRVAEILSISPKKIRRILRNAGLLSQNEQ